MARQRYIQVGLKLVPIEDLPRRERKTPMIITDRHTPFRSMADGKMYDSKSSYRKSLRSLGYEEMGSDRPDLKPAAEPDIKSIERDVAETIRGMGNG